jgi:hypothetical protein
MCKVCDVPVSMVEHVERGLAEVGNDLHARARPVYVLAVNEVEAARWQEPRGKARSVAEGHLFHSALAASLHLGYDHNMVAQMLGKEKRKLAANAAKLPGGENSRVRPRVTIRGVTLQYEDDVKE